MKHYIKIGSSVLLFATFLVFALASEDDVDNKDISTVEDANELTDSKFEEFNEKYEELCGKKRNDKLKGEFGSLGRKIVSYREKISQAENLNYDEQNEARKYFADKLEKNDALKSLSYGNIECW